MVQNFVDFDLNIDTYKAIDFICNLKLYLHSCIYFLLLC
jgi:hypothetical protein